jgi:zinc finger CCHC domain-containing protein 9
MFIFKNCAFIISELKMTRFARARGSKSSNERIPEEATSWNQMRQQLQEKQQVPRKDKTETKRKIKFEVSDIQRGEWAVFEEHPTISGLDSDDKRIKKHKNFVSASSGRDISEPEKDYSRKEDKLHTVATRNARVQKKDTVKKYSKKIKNLFADIHVSDSEYMTGKAENCATHRKKQKIEVKKKKQGFITTSVTETAIKDHHGKDLENQHGTKGGKPTSQKRKQKKQSTNKQSNAESPLYETDRRTANRKDVFQQNKNENFRKKYDERKNKDRSYKWTKSNTHAVQMYINGKEIEVIKFDGFPLKKEDAERLEELRQNLIKQGIPRKEVVAIMKRERRKAEKLLARERKKVCFHCRNSGHVLSQCPELGSSSESGTGICFKCGSTEHTHFQCQVIRTQDFRYAECFVCKEQGHIARQCPDNPRGLYPKGGACKVCGDVTHLKKDCPDLIKEKEQQTITLGTLDNNSLDALEEVKQTNYTPEQNIMKKRTVVKF